MLATRDHSISDNGIADTASAAAILADPDICVARPQLRLLAWAALKSAKGQTVRQHVLTRMGAA